MKRPIPIMAALASAVALALAFGAFAQGAPDAAKEKELAQAREDLQRAARRVAELSREAHGNPDMIIERRLMRRPVLGVILEGDDGAGVRIAAVTPESGAAKAGLRSGDRITAIAGKPLKGSDGHERLSDARVQLRTIDGKTPVALAFVRGGSTASVSVMPSPGDQVLMLHDGDNVFEFGGAPLIHMDPEGIAHVEARRAVRVAPAGIAPQIHREIVRGKLCEDGDCRLPALAEAFRWNGLNLASVDKDLGRYFGTDNGVLVLSIPEDMGDLRPGDVLKKIDGKVVTTPREAMAAANANKPGTAVPVEYLRDRKLLTTKMTLPERAMLRLPIPPAPPAPPAPPSAPRAVLPAPAAAPMIPPPPPPAAPEPPSSPPPPEPQTLL